VQADSLQVERPVVVLTVRHHRAIYLKLPINIKEAGDRLFFGYASLSQSRPKVSLVEGITVPTISTQLAI